MKRAFSAIELPTRSAKPRSTGMTMMVDWGLPLGAQRGILEIAGEFIDLGKVAVGISGLISEEMLVSKLAAYREVGIEPFPGGMYVEIAYNQDKVAHYYEECRRVGYRLVEVSDNVVPLPSDVKEDLIRRATDEYGLRVLGEVGSKHVKTDAQSLITDIQGCLEAGSWKVLVEAAEIVTEDGLDMSLLEILLGEIDPADLLFELPGKWLANVHGHQIYRMMIWLVEHLGTEVNIANLLPEDIIPLETLRTRVGVNVGF